MAIGLGLVEYFNKKNNPQLTPPKRNCKGAIKFLLFLNSMN
jgi:hypothetical protein